MKEQKELCVERVVMGSGCDMARWWLGNLYIRFG